MKSNHSGIFIYLKPYFFFLSFLAIISCSKHTEPPSDISGSSESSNTNINPEAMDTGKITYLALGDSYTIGESVAATDRFPAQLVKMLQRENINVQSPDIVAVTGWTTANLLNALQNEQLNHNYTFVTLLIGVNNQYQGRSLDEYRTQFSRLLDSAVHFAGNKKNHVFVLSIPDYSVTPFASGSDQQQIAAEIDEFNAANKLIADNYGVQYLDITGISREARTDPGLVATDGLHPSAEQYMRWDQLLAPMVLGVLKN